MTNGEMIKATFPHYDIEIDEHKSYARVFYEDFYTTYPLIWWDTEYKEPTTKKCTTCAYREIDGKPHEMCKSCVCGNRYRQESCDDCISRFSAKQIIRNHYCSIPSKAFKKLIEELDSLSPVTPQEPKTGHWTYHRNEKGNWENICSNCGLDSGVGYPYLYCPSCGAKMVEPQESEDKDKK